MSKANSSTIEARVSDFIAKAIERTKCVYEGKSKKANALEKDMGNIYRSLRACGRAEQEALLPLLNHPDASVRAEAAQFVLDFDPSKALPVLEALAAVPGGGVPGSDAELTLDVWRSGKYRIAYELPARKPSERPTLSYSGRLGVRRLARMLEPCTDKRNCTARAQSKF